MIGRLTYAEWLILRDKLASALESNAAYLGWRVLEMRTVEFWPADNAALFTTVAENCAELVDIRTDLVHGAGVFA